MRRIVTSIRFTPESVLVEFEEVWRNGLMRQQLIQIPLAGDYLDEVLAVSTAVDALLEDVLEDAAAAPPLSSDELMDLLGEEDDAEEDGIGFNGG